MSEWNLQIRIRTTRDNHHDNPVSGGLRWRFWLQIALALAGVLTTVFFGCVLL